MTMSLAGNLMIASSTVPQSVFSRGVCLIVHHDANGAIGVMLNRPIQPPPPELIGMLIGASVELSDGEPNDGDASDIEQSLGGEGFTSDDADDSPASCGAKNGGKKSGRSRLPASHVGDAADNQSGGFAGGSAMIVGPGGGGLSGQPHPGGGNGLVHFGGPVSGPVVAIHGSPDFAEAEAGEGIYVAAQKEHLENLMKSGQDFRLILGHSTWSSQQLADEFAAGYWHVLPATAETVLPVRIDLWPYLIRRATGSSVASWVGARDSGGWAGLN
jgi:putative transcriptional regulator